MSSSEIIINCVGIDKEKADKLLKWLILIEKNSVKTKEKSDTEMIRVIQKKIEEIAKCY